MCTPQKHKRNLLLDKDKLNLNVLVNRRKSKAKRTTGWKRWEAVLPLLFRRVPYSLSWDSNSQQLLELMNSAPSPLISGVAWLLPAYEHIPCCSLPSSLRLPLPQVPFLFQPSPTSSPLHTQVSWKQACSLAFPKRNLPTSTAPDWAWYRSWTTSTVHTYLEFIHLPQPWTKRTEKPSAILLITDML